MLKIIAMGKVYLQPAEEAVRGEVADMLRYDGGEITSLDIEDTGRGWRYTAHITCESYTKARWDSFLIKTEEERDATENATRCTKGTRNPITR